MDTYILKYRETPSRGPPMAIHPHLGVESFHIMVPLTHLVLGLRARPLLLAGNGLASLRFSRRPDTSTRPSDFNTITY